MAKKYDQERFDGLFQGSAQSVGFFSEKSVDTSKQYEQKTKELNRDLTTKSKSLAAQFKVQSSQLAADKAKAAANDKAFQGLLSLAGKSINTFGQIAKINEQAARQAEIDKKRAEEDARQEAINAEATGFLFGDDVPIIDGAVETEQAQSVTAQATGVIAQEIEQETGDAQLAEDVRGPAADAQTGRAVSAINTHEAAARIGVDLQEYMTSDTVVTLPDGTQILARDARTGPELAAVAAQGVRELSRSYGLAGMDPRVLRSTYLGAARAAYQAVVAQRGAEMREALQGERAETFYQEATAEIRAGTVSLEESYQNLYRNLQLAGVSADPRKLNELTRQHIINLAKGMGLAGVAILEDLKGVQQRPGQAGTELGKGRHAEEINTAIRQIRSGAITEQNIEQNEGRVRLLNLQQQHQKDLLAAETEEQRVAINERYEAELLELARGGNLQAQEQLQAEQGKDNRYNPLAVGELMDQVAAGEAISEAQVNELVESGTITAQEGKSVLQAAGSSAEMIEDAVKPYKSDIDKTVKGVVTSQLRSQGVSAEGNELAGINAQLSEEVQSYMAQWIQSNPRAEAAQIRAEAQRYINQHVKERLQGVTLNQGVVEGFTYSQPRTYNNPNTQRPSRVLTNLETPQIVALNQDNDKDNDIDAYNDRLVTSEEFLAGVQALASGNIEAIPQRIRDLAAAAGMTPRNLIYAQGIGQGVDVDAAVRSALDTPADTAGRAEPLNQGPTDIRSGVRHLQGMGFSRRGAAFLAANIQQESSWNGMRSWGGVYNPSTGAMDGTSRNGGLISWASWADDPARLGRIEQYLGKSIEKATHAEQLEAMKWEMKQSYPSAYRVFTNPNATDAQLRRASKEYWGYGHEGNRFGSFLNQALAA